MYISAISDSQLKLISELAHKIWPIAYQDILSKEQLSYMLANFYSLEQLRQDIEKGIIFYLIEENQAEIGFLGIELNHPSAGNMKIHKLYLLPERQGSGLGRATLAYIAEIGKLKHQKSITLNVNKYNPAIEFYKKCGFSFQKAEIISIGNGYVMDDFVLQKRLK